MLIWHGNCFNKGCAEIEISNNPSKKEVSKVIEMGGIPGEALNVDTSIVFRLQPKEESGDEGIMPMWSSDLSIPMDWLMCEV